MFERDPASLRNVYASGGYGFLHDMLEIAGGRNVFADVKQQAVQASTEMLIASKPDVIIELLYGDSLKNADIAKELRAWDALASVPAVRSHRISALTGDEFVVPGPRVVDATRKLARALHPDAVQMKTLVSWSSGKDSAWMVHTLRQRGDVEIGALLTTINEPAQRVAMHAVRVEVLQAQAAALGFPLWLVPIPSPCPTRSTKRRCARTVARAVGEGFTHAAFGDLFLEDIRRYREERLAGSGLTPLFPLFGTDADTPRLAREMIAGGPACADHAA